MKRFELAAGLSGIGRVLLLALIAGGALAPFGRCAESASRCPQPIRSSVPGNWIEAGAEIRFFENQPVPDDVAGIDAAVCDSAGREVVRQEIPAGEFRKNGWRWQPATPGFYTVRFEIRTLTGTRGAIGEEVPYDVRDTAGKLTGQTKIWLDTHTVAVLPCATRKPQDIPTLFGLSGSTTAAHLQLASLVGFHFIRGDLRWNRIEPESGRYDFSVYDGFLAKIHEYGFSYVAILAVTPQWLASNPSDKIGFVVPIFWGSPPRDMSKWGDFVRAVVKRYPAVKRWEIWNEPNLPGQSCSWHGTPEEYLTMLRLGYQAVKAEQPEGDVWFGGIGMRYLPFYTQIMQLGGQSYFDVLPLHGQWAAPQPFAAVNKRLGAASKRWINGENHAILISAGENPLPSEEAAARNLLLEYINCVRLGGEGVAVHTILSSGSREKLAFSRSHGNTWNHITGFFSDDTYPQPRLPALVHRNFSDLFTGKIRYLDGYSFAGGQQSAVLMESDSGKVLLVWQAGTEPVSADPQLTRAVGAESTIADWEARKLTAPAWSLRPEQMYFIRNPDMAVVSDWKNKEQVVHPVRQNIELDHSVHGSLTPAPLLTPEVALRNPAAVSWLPLVNYVPAQGTNPAGISARFAASFTRGGMELAVEVTDRTHVQPSQDKALWEGDSVQIALDSGGSGLPAERLEFTAALGPQGPVLWKQHLPPIMGDMPTHLSYEDSAVKYGAVRVEPMAGGLRYLLRIDREDLYPFVYQERKPVRFSILVNNNDGAGRLGWLEWTPGIARDKEPSQYGDLTQPAGGVKIGQKDMRIGWTGTTLRIDGETARAEGSGGTCAIASAPVKLVPGGHYELNLQARGTIAVQAMLVGNPDEPARKLRLDILPKTVLNAQDWSDLHASFIAPEDLDSASLAIFGWNQAGWYEIRQTALRGN